MTIDGNMSEVLKSIIRQDLARREASFHCISCNNWIGSNVEKVRTALE